MAECKNCVHNKVCAEINSLKCRKDFIWYDAKSGCPYYTADVVPKSEADNLIEVIDNTTQQFLELHDLYQNAKREVERLEHILNCYALQYGTVMDKHTVIEKERAEVAREIFEEIEKYAELQIESLNIAEKVDLSGAAFFSGGKQAFVLLLDRLAELKKKYTEVDNDRNSKD